MTQNDLSKKFQESQTALKKYGINLDNGWGSTSNSEIDTLWDSNTNKHYERAHPDGEWNLIPPLNK